MFVDQKTKQMRCTPQQITIAGADYVKRLSPYLSLKELEAALEYTSTEEFHNTKRWSKTLVLTIEREIRKKKRAAEKERRLRLKQQAYD